MKNMPYTEDQLEFIRKNYPLMTGKELTKRFNALFNDNRTCGAILGTCKREGISSGRDGRFKKGQKSWNKGKKGYMGANKTSFCKGHTPKNHKPVGYERINKNGYVEVKTKEPNKFELKHRTVWTNENGPIPKGMIIWFVDGDRTNCNIENLEIISRQEQVRRNQLKTREADESIQPTLKLVAKITAKTHQISNRP